MSTREETMRQRYADLSDLTRDEWCAKHNLALSNWYVYMDKAGLRKQTRKQVRGVRTTQKTSPWTVTVENDVLQWFMENVQRGKRSALVNELLKQHIASQEGAKSADDS